MVYIAPLLLDSLIDVGYYELLLLAEKMSPNFVSPNTDAVTKIVGDGQLELLKLLHNNKLHIEPVSLDEAAKQGNLNILQWAVRNTVYKPTVSTANKAAQGDKLFILEWLYANYRILPDQSGVTLATRGGHLTVLEWIADKVKLYPSVGDLGEAAKRGWLDVLKWVYGVNGTLPVVDDIVYVILNNQVAVLRWLKSIGHYIPTRTDAQYAVNGRAIDVLAWLLEQEIVPVQSVVDSAATKGYLSMLELLAKYNLYPRAMFMDSVANGGHLDVLKWMVEVMKLDLSTLNVATIIRLKRYDVVRWLESKGIITTEKEVRKLISERSPETSAAIRWMYSRYPYYTFTQGDVDYAVEKGNNHIVSFFIKKGMYPSQAALDKVVSTPGPNLDTVKLVVTETGMVPGQRAVNISAGLRFRTDMMKFLSSVGVYPE
jgi:hypothetical protein